MKQILILALIVLVSCKQKETANPDLVKERTRRDSIYAVCNYRGHVFSLGRRQFSIDSFYSLIDTEDSSYIVKSYQQYEECARCSRLIVEPYKPSEYVKTTWKRRIIEHGYHP